VIARSQVREKKLFMNGKYFIAPLVRGSPAAFAETLYELKKPSSSSVFNACVISSVGLLLLILEAALMVDLSLLGVFPSFMSIQLDPGGSPNRIFLQAMKAGGQRSLDGCYASEDDARCSDMPATHGVDSGFS
jgi:hypothetical protein